MTNVYDFLDEYFSRQVMKKNIITLTKNYRDNVKEYDYGRVY